MRRACSRLLVALAAVALLPACQGLGARAKPGAEHAQHGTAVTFQPASPEAALRVDQAAYPTLYSPDSFALWVGPELTAQRRAESLAEGETIDEEADALAPALDARFLVIECHVVSAFADASLAYDAARLRGVTVALELPGGIRVPPAQLLVGSAMTEEPRGAITAYGRTVLAIFPREALTFNAPASAGPPGAARLVLEAHNSRFYFEWSATAPVTGPVPLRDRPAAQAAKLRYNEFYRTLSGLAHTFD